MLSFDLPRYNVDTGHMRQAQRILRVKELFGTQEFASFAELCEKFGASKSSIRRDLMELEANGILRRVHGGAISLQTRDEILDFGVLSSSAHEEKVRIGKLAASLVNNGDTVILGGGSTVAEVAKNLLPKAIQVVTNSLPVAQVFWDTKELEVTITGGYLYPRTGVQIGPICEKMLSTVSADVLIMGIRGISENGLSDSNSLMAESLRAMMRASRKVILVADHSKFGHDAMIRVAGLREVHHVITDKAIDHKYQQLLKANGISCSLA